MNVVKWTVPFDTTYRDTHLHFEDKSEKPYIKYISMTIFLGVKTYVIMCK